MQIENHKEEVPFAYYQEKFASLDPMETESRVGRCYAQGVFTVKLLGKDYCVTHPDAAITPEAPLPVQTFLLRWLLEGRQEPFGGKYLTFREMPWGELYIKPYTGRVLTRAAFTFGARPAAFAAACEKMGARKLPRSDAGYEFQLLPGLFIQILVWEGDEEFPPNAQVLYSDNFAALAAEDRVVAGDILISAIKANM
ncbi:MAG: DUF3786 domain-containing protein [Faecousia sp.]